MIPSYAVALLVHSLDVTKFGKFLERVLAKLPLVPGARPLDVFSFDEREKLISVFELRSLADLALILEWCVSFFEQAAFDQVKPEALRVPQLNEDFAQMVYRVWAAHSGALIERLKGKPVSTHQLADVNFVLNVDVASKARAQINRPNAYLQLVTDDVRGQSEKLNLELDHGQLLQLYDKLEDIQKQLDSLTG